MHDPECRKIATPLHIILYVLSHFHFSDQTPANSGNASKDQENFESQSKLAAPGASTEGKKFVQASAGFSFEDTKSGAGGVGSKPKNSANASKGYEKTESQSTIAAATLPSTFSFGAIKSSATPGSRFTVGASKPALAPETKFAPASTGFSFGTTKSGVGGPGKTQTNFGNASKVHQKNESQSTLAGATYPSMFSFGVSASSAPAGFGNTAAPAITAGKHFSSKRCMYSF